MELFLLTLTGAFERKPLIFKKNMDKNKIKFFFKGRNVSQSLFVDSLTKSIEQKLCGIFKDNDKRALANIVEEQMPNLANKILNIEKSTPLP